MAEEEEWRVKCPAAASSSLHGLPVELSDDGARQGAEGAGYGAAVLVPPE
jgi:hypothetical protein